jgi:hypothetical protein
MEFPIRHKGQIQDDGILPEPPLTPFAKRYGALPEKHFSGLTQVPEISPRSLSDQERQQIAEVEAYQRANLGRFTTRELRQLDCLPDRELKAANLREIITPIL